MTKENSLTQFDAICLEMRGNEWDCVEMNEFFDLLDSMYAYARMKKNIFSFFIMEVIYHEKTESIPIN